MNEIVSLSRTYKIGNQVWQTNHKGEWFVQCFGWSPYRQGPGYEWVHVKNEQVPKELLNAK